MRAETEKYNNKDIIWLEKSILKKTKRNLVTTAKKKKHGKFAPIVIRSVMVSKFTLHLPTF